MRLLGIERSAAYMYLVYPITFAGRHQKTPLVLHVTQPKTLPWRLQAPEHQLQVLSLTQPQPAQENHPLLLLLTLPSYSLTSIKMLVTVVRVLPWGLGLHSQMQ
jgi:hypothetical protein